MKNKTPKHPFHAYYVPIFYTKPLSLRKIKEHQAVKAIKAAGVPLRIYCNNIPAGCVLEYENMQDRGVMIHWPTGVFINGDPGASFVAEMIELDNLFTRYEELIGGAAFDPYKASQKFIINLNQTPLRFTV